MDKKWIGLIIILIVGLLAMGYIVTSSPSVGNALTVIKDVSVTLPDGFRILDTSSDEAKLSEDNGDNRIVLKCMGKDKNPVKAYKSELKKQKSKGEFEVTENGNNTIKLTNYTSGKVTLIKFFDKENRTFSMKVDDFTGEAKQVDDINFIIDNIVLDFKQNKS